MADTPDWTNVASNVGIIAAQGNMANGAGITLDLTQYQSVIVLLSGRSQNTKIFCPGTWVSDSVNDFFMDGFECNAVPLVGQNSVIQFETPVISPILQFSNQSGQILDYIVIGSSRAVPCLKVLTGNQPLRRFSYNGVFTANVQVPLTQQDGGLPDFVSNGQSWYDVGQNTAGTLVENHISASGAPDAAGFVVIPASGSTTGFVAFGKGRIGFSFIPSANNASGFVSMLIAQAQL